VELINTNSVRQFIIDVKPEAQDFELDATTSLFDVGALDSYTVVMLIQHLEERLDIFENLESILKLLKTKYEVK
jgi:acyl carrier protein